MILWNNLNVMKPRLVGLIDIHERNLYPVEVVASHIKDITHQHMHYRIILLFGLLEHIILLSIY